MAEYEPYTKEERERLVASMERWNMLGQDRVIEVFAGAVVIEVRRYEATVAALEAENARLAPLAAVGKAVEGMPESCALVRKDGYWAGYWVLSIEATEYNECNARVGDMTGWYEKPSGALDVLADYGAPPQAALAAAKAEGNE